MPNQASLAVADGKASPLTHTFAPLGAPNVGGEVVAKWINRVASALTGGAELVFNYFKQRMDGGTTHRVVTILPITQVVNGVDTVTRVLKATTTVEIPKDSTAIERKDIRVLHTNVLANSQIAGGLDNAEPVYS